LALPTLIRQRLKKFLVDAKEQHIREPEPPNAPYLTTHSAALAVRGLAKNNHADNIGKGRHPGCQPNTT
jgi:hypothetical protein